MATLRIPVLSGSIRAGRNTPRLAMLLARKLAERGDVDTSVIDLADLHLPLLEERLKNLADPPVGLVQLAGEVAGADAVLIATPEYNKGYPAALKNAVDALGDEWKRKPIGIAAHSTGAFGGTVVLQQLRAVMLGLGAVPIPATLNVPHVTKALAEDGSSLDSAVEDRAARFVQELCSYATALRGLR